MKNGTKHIGTTSFEMQKEGTPAARAKTMETMHYQLQGMKAMLPHLKSESQFYVQVLKAPIFDKNVPNTFERIQGYLAQLTQWQEELNTLSHHIVVQEQELGAVCPKADESLWTVRKREHLALVRSYEILQKKLNGLKSELFQFIEGRLRV
ncbi:hypothetical protein [Maribacter sp. 2307ULW6-5]|uniref:hypothetical protein n=1 Tax=Maribacter sp. 2307ULW6-5 TaxID=3386275 RepID=UPI0039BD3341